MYRLPLLALALMLGGESVAQPPDTTRRPSRAVLEERFRQRYEQLLVERLSLSQSQLAQVVEINARLDGRRRELFREERAVRVDMRAALQGGDDQATQERVAGLMDRALRVQRARLDLVETEQRELAAVLTPVQRAKYLGMQEQLRRRADDMMRRADGDSLEESPTHGRSGSPGRRPFPRRPPGSGGHVPSSR